MEICMDADLTRDLQTKIYNICNQLLTDNNLITTKSVLSRLLEVQVIQSIHVDSNIDNMQDYVSNTINSWRLSRFRKQTQQTSENSKKIVKNSSNVYILQQKLSNYKKQLVKANREVQFLKAKLKSLNSFYRRQRQELIMRIEGMLYK